MNPSDEIREAARRGMQIVVDGLHTTNLYDRTAFSDLRTLYNNMFQTSIMAARLEAALIQAGISFNGIESEPESGTSTEQTVIVEYVDGIVGSSVVSGDVITSAGRITITGNYSPPDSQPSGTSHFVLNEGKPFILDPIRRAE